MPQSAQVATGAISLTVIDGIPTTTSNEVAQQFGKRHDNVIQVIKSLREQVGPDHALNFQEMVNEVQIGGGAIRKDPAYRLTRDGFTLLAMGFTGKKALQFKLAYIDAFNRMERELSEAAKKATVQISHATIGAAQAQHIKELVLQVVQATGQSYGEVWGRLHNKFCVNSYLSLSATQFDDVCKYLAAKLQEHDKSAAYAALTAEEVRAFRSMVRGDCLEDTLSRLTDQVTKGNGYPLSLFMPLWVAINQRLMQTRAVGFKS